MSLPERAPEFRSVSASDDWWMDNVRIVDGDGRVDSSWYVAPGNEVARERAWEVLREYRAAEPEAGWHLETRGTIASWHDWEQL